MGVLARRISLEIIPVCLLVVYAGLVDFYVLAARPRKIGAATVSVPSEHAVQQQQKKEI